MRSITTQALTAALIVLALGAVARVQAEETTTVALTKPQLRLVHVTDGLRSVAPGRDLSKLPETSIYRTAKAAGMDLADPPGDLLQHQYRDGRLFYVFYKQAENAFGDRPYVIQRIKKTERTWPTEEATAPEIRVTYQVEVFKTLGGAIKRPDQHHGSYGIRDNWRREIVKEYEIGFGEIPGRCEGTDWPFAQNRLFEYVQRYGEEREIYDAVHFFAATPWTLAVSLAQDGTYRVASKELGFDAPETEPDPEGAKAPPAPGSEGLVLEAGAGSGAVEIGVSTLADLKVAWGEPLQATTFPNGAVSASFACGLTCSLIAEGTLKNVFTRPGFQGRTESGIAHGDSRARVMQVMGVSPGRATDAWTWPYPGVRFWFDGFNRVSRIMVLAK